MKKTYLFIVACAAVMVVSCEKVKHLADISKDFTYTETTKMPGVPGSLPDTIPPGGINAYLPPIALGTNAQQNIQGAGSSVNLVKYIKLTKFSANITEPAGSNFDFMDTIRLYVSADGQAEKLVGHKYGIPKGQQKIDLDCEDVDLKDYFLKDTMYIRFGGHFVGVPDSNSKVELSSTFNMLANPIQ